jgi:hypothetical protein
VYCETVALPSFAINVLYCYSRIRATLMVKKTGRLRGERGGCWSAAIRTYRVLRTVLLPYLPRKRICRPIDGDRVRAIPLRPWR